MSNPDILTELEARWGPVGTWRRFRPERQADREWREREAARHAILDAIEAGTYVPPDDDLPF